MTDKPELTEEDVEKIHRLVKDMSDEEIDIVRTMAAGTIGSKKFFRGLRSVALYAAGLLVAWATIGEKIKEWWVG